VANIYDLSDTWNDAGTTFTSIKMNVTDTASAAGSLLLDLQVGGASKFKVSKGGVVLVGDGAAGTPSLSFTGASNKGFYQRSDSAVGMSWGSDEVFHFSQGQVAIGGGWALAFGSGSLASVAADTYLYRDAANTLAQRNGTNAQTFRLYNTYTDAANYERGGLEWTGNVMNIGSFAAAGTGLVRDVQFMRNGAVFAQLISAGWNFLTHVVFNIDNTYDIGQNGAFRPRDIHVARDLKVAGRTHVSVVATASLPAAGAAEDGRVLIEDAAAGDRNFIIYAGGQRFRIDGGVAF